MNQDNKNEGCCPSIHAKIFEIILIIGFTLSLILLIVKLIILVWCIKYSNSLLIIGIILMALSTISLVLSIILRVWRSNGSVFNTKFLSSFCIASINFVLVIINILSSIYEEILFSFVISIFILYFGGEDNEENDYIIFILGRFERMPESQIKEYYRDVVENFDEVFKKAKKYLTALDIMKKTFLINIGEDFEDLNEDERLKKVKVLKILPWITINFNILIQVIMLIFIIILILKISAKFDSGSQHLDTNQSVNNKMLGNSNNLNPNGSESKELKEKKEKKKKKRRKKKSV